MVPTAGLVLSETYLPIDRVEEITNLSRSTIRRLVSTCENPLPHIRIGKRLLRFPERALHNWMRDRAKV